jgi:hypothetical protein
MKAYYSAKSIFWQSNDVQAVNLAAKKWDGSVHWFWRQAE